MECLNKTVVENSGNSYNESAKFLESTYKMIVEDLIDDAILEVCFEVHRAAKLGYFFLEYPENYSEESQSAEHPEDKKNDPTVKPKDKGPAIKAFCPVCTTQKDADNFARHLASCMGLPSSTTRTSSRAVSQKIADSYRFWGENEYDSDSGIRKKSKKNKGKGNARRKTKLQGSSNAKLADPNVNYNEMTPEKIQEFLNRKCGVLTKRTNKMCAKTFKCCQHTDEERRNVRRILLKDTNGQIDVDTLDVNEEFSFTMETVSAYPSQEKQFL